MNPSGSSAKAHSFKLPTHQLRYLTWGQPGRPPLILIHGGLDNAETWEDVAARLSQKFHVYALDLRGHGDSDWSSTGDYLPEAYLADIASFLRDVPGWPARVVGHSMGARLSLQLMGAMPEAIGSLVAIEGMGSETTPPDDIDPDMREWLEKRRIRSLGSSAEKLGLWLQARLRAERKVAVHPDLESRVIKQLADKKKRLTREQAELFVRTNMRKVEGGWSWKFDPLTRWQTANEQMQPQEPLWQSIQGPVLHLYGRQSWASPPGEETLAHFCDSRLVVIPDAGHWVQFNQPEIVANAIEQFFTEIEFA